MAARLNVSACFAEGEMHEDALQHAMAAVALGGQLIASGSQPGAQPETGGDNAQRTGTQASLTIRPDDYAMLAVAYHKTAEAHEHMKQWSQATLAYTQAYEVVRRSLGPYHQLTKSFEKSARCPRRPVPPEVPLNWRGSEKKKLPHLPPVERTLSGRTTTVSLQSQLRQDSSAAQEPLRYGLDPAKF